jgi:protoheme IX farnesyltransferase
LRSSNARIFPDLIRIIISLSVTLSAFAAWVVASGKVSLESVLPMTGIFLLACGASSLNQIQEKTQDARMPRTMNRPLPSGKITPKQAFIITLSLLGAGFALLATGSYWTCILLGFINILWYNGLYTWLKKRTAFAVVPGALSGVIPVFMGWSAAGGHLSDHTVLLLSFFLLIWQIPHFWLLMLKYADEYRMAGFPVMTDIFSFSQFRNIILAWMIGATGTSLVMVLSGTWMLFTSKILILSLNLIILSLFFQQLCFARNPRYRLMFISMNLFLLLVLSLLVAEKIFS